MKKQINDGSTRAGPGSPRPTGRPSLAAQVRDAGERRRRDPLDGLGRRHKRDGRAPVSVPLRAPPVGEDAAAGATSLGQLDQLAAVVDQ